MQRTVTSVWLIALSSILSGLIDISSQRPNFETSPFCVESPRKKEYKYPSKIETSWGRAWNHCASQGWNLLSIQSIDEELEITEKLVNHGNRFYWTSGRHLGESWFWVTNATDTGIAMKKILYKNWGDDQPPTNSIGITDDAIAVQMKEGQNYGWKPVFSRKLDDLYVVCERVLE